MIATAVLLSAVFISLTAGQVDQTLTPEASGKAVVKAVVSRIRQSGIFPDDRSLLRRIAFVESKDGTDQQTYRAGYHGGIWQVDQIGFQDTQNTASNESKLAVNEQFEIDWPSVSWMDLRKPLYSGLAARLRLSNYPIPPASNIEQQGQYYYNTSNSTKAAGTVQKFVDDVQALAAQTECRSRIDLIFVLDASGSIGSANFQLMQNLSANIVRNLNIGPDQTRVGVVRYNSSASVQFSLNTHMTNASLLQAIANIPCNTGGGTNTAAAILTCIQQFSTSYGARPRSSGIPRIAIVVTDGSSYSQAATIAAAQMAHSKNILIYAVGVGGNVDMTELAAIASDPDSQYVHSLSSFNSGLSSLQETLNEEACTAPAISDVGQAITRTLEQNEASYIQLDLPVDGMTLRLNVSQGSVVMYGSNKIQNPNEAFYDFKLSNNQPKIFVTGKTFFPSITKRQISTNNTDDITIYISIEGQSASNNFTLNTTIGDTTEPTTEPTTETTGTTSIFTNTSIATSLLVQTTLHNIVSVSPITTSFVPANRTTTDGSLLSSTVFIATITTGLLVLVLVITVVITSIVCGAVAMKRKQQSTSGAEGVVDVVPIDDNPAYKAMKRITMNKNTAYETVDITSHDYETVII